MSFNKNPDRMTVAEAAEFAGVSEATIRSNAANGKIASYDSARLGLRIKTPSLKKWMEKRDGAAPEAKSAKSAKSGKSKAAQRVEKETANIGVPKPKRGGRKSKKVASESEEVEAAEQEEQAFGE